eukprot:Pompholyxophrys_punicea_v1_NODE_4_length_9023_cov_16.536240.p3 type:complete len:102 gc:universal NODE_4_length_9023_cov_16.536240:5468-5773(+)
MARRARGATVVTTLQTTFSTPVAACCKTILATNTNTFNTETTSKRTSLAAVLRCQFIPNCTFGANLRSTVHTHTCGASSARSVRQFKRSGALKTSPITGTN